MLPRAPVLPAGLCRVESVPTLSRKDLKPRPRLLLNRYLPDTTRFTSAATAELSHAIDLDSKSLCVRSEHQAPIRPEAVDRVRGVELGFDTDRRTPLEVFAQFPCGPLAPLLRSDCVDQRDCEIRTGNRRVDGLAETLAILLAGVEPFETEPRHSTVFQRRA